MTKKAKLLVGVVTLAAVLALSLGSVAMAAGSTDTAAATTTCAGQRYGNSWLSDICNEAVSDLLGMTPEEIRALRLEGKTLVEVAATKNITEAQLVEAIMTAKTAEIEARVAAGTLTQEQADVMLQNVEQRTIEAVNRTSVGPFGTPGNGARVQAKNQQQAGACNGLGTGTATRAGKMYGRNR